MDAVVIVGGGLGGAWTAKQLRTASFTGRITVIGDEREVPYDRPPLSKEVLLGKLDHPALPISFAELDVEHRAGTEARGLAKDGSRWVVGTDNSEVPADHVVVATGARPVCPALFAGHQCALTLRTLDDARALCNNLRRGVDVVVVGAGWIGAEVASSAAAIGCAVSVVEAQPTPAAASLGTEVGQWFLPWYEESGIHTYFSRTVVATSSRAVELNGGTILPADVVVVGVGVAPSTQWLAAGPVELDSQGAVLVDEYLESTARGVYALGDCAAYPSRRYGVRLRPEHWMNAQQAARTVAHSVTGERGSFDPVPYFWSKQFDRMVQYVGHHQQGDDLVFRGDPGGHRWSACWVRDGRPTALLGVSRPREVVEARRLFEQNVSLDVGRLGEESTPLADCVVA